LKTLDNNKSNTIDYTEFMMAALDSDKMIKDKKI